MNEPANKAANHLAKSNLAKSKCVPCEGGVPPLDRPSIDTMIQSFSHWGLSEDGKSIQRKINCKTFAKAIEQIREIASIAESQQHHPNLHLTGYRYLQVEWTTHAIGGLSENDFVMAAKIDQLLDDTSVHGKHCRKPSHD
ncbi:4a-hydroxytetrahydrobiopterin dehydratase [Planctomycetes bacterium CA13]